MELTKEAKRAADQIAGKANGQENLTPEQIGAVAAIMQTPEHLEAKERERFEKLRQIATAGK